MTELICICCPRGCRLSVDENKDYEVTGASCEKGVEYGKMEIKDPRRVLTSTVRIEGAALRRCSVKTSLAIPKGELFKVMREIDGVVLKSPVKVGDLIIENVCGTGADIVSTRSL